MLQRCMHARATEARSEGYSIIIYQKWQIAELKWIPALGCEGEHMCMHSRDIVIPQWKRRNEERNSQCETSADSVVKCEQSRRAD